ncbi:methyltransferase [bacterium]|nr:methyltransferase [bacterium]
MKAFPSILATKEAAAAIRTGYPWLFAGHIRENSSLALMEPGELVTLLDDRAQPLGTGYYNGRVQLACRVLTTNPRDTINEAWFAWRFKKALEMREAAIGQPFYRLIHAEADGLPGLVIDRFGDYLSIQVATAGMERLKPVWLSALKSLLNPTAIVWRNDIAQRKLEGLSQTVEVEGDVPSLIELKELDRTYMADLVNGQKTGWFYDQRDNRTHAAELVTNVSRNVKTAAESVAPATVPLRPSGSREQTEKTAAESVAPATVPLRPSGSREQTEKTAAESVAPATASLHSSQTNAGSVNVLDVFSHSGGFAMACARAGANVTLVDSSALALSLAAKAATKNNVATQCDYIESRADEALEKLSTGNNRYRLIILDPPAFVKERKHKAAGLKGYEKLCRLAAPMVEPGGWLMLCSCSHHADIGSLKTAMKNALEKAGRTGRFIRTAGAASDHPSHPKLPEGSYLKAITMQLN